MVFGCFGKGEKGGKGIWKYSRCLRQCFLCERDGDGVDGMMLLSQLSRGCYVVKMGRPVKVIEDLPCKLIFQSRRVSYRRWKAYPFASSRWPSSPGEDS